MKCSFIFLLLTSICFSVNTLAQSLTGYTIQAIQVECPETTICNQFKKSFTKLVGKYNSSEHFQEVLREYLNDVGYEKLDFSLEGPDDAIVLFMKIVPKKIITEIKLFMGGVLDETGLAESLLSKPDSFIDKEVLEQDKDILSHKLTNLGFSKTHVEFKVEEHQAGYVKLRIEVSVEDVIRIRQINYQCLSPYVQKILKNNFDVYLEQPYARDFIQQEVGVTKKILLEQGYYQVDLQLNTVVEGNLAILNFTCKDESLIQVEINDHMGLLQKDDLFLQLRPLFSKVDQQFIIKELTQFIEKKYGAMGRRATVKIQETSTTNGFQEKVLKYNIEILPTTRTSVASILFRGNLTFEASDLMKLFFKNATDLAKSNYIDESYYPQFIDELKKKYIHEGMLTTNIYYLLRQEAKDQDQTGEAPEEAQRTKYPSKTIIFDINEGVKTQVVNFEFLGLKGDTVYEEIKKRVFNIESGSVFDPMKFDKALEDFLMEVKSRGHFDAHYIEDPNIEMVQYSKSAQEVSLHVSIHLGPVYRVNNVYLIGLNKTRESVVKRKVRLERGSLLSTQLIEQVQANIANLALFKTYSVKILNYTDDNFYRDIAIHVQEKDYGSIEVSPGYRTDLGVRLAGKISYGNLGGLNQSVSLDVELNVSNSCTFFHSSSSCCKTSLPLPIFSNISNCRSKYSSTSF